MKKTSLEKQILNVLRIIKTGGLSASKLRNLYKNAQDHNEITDAQRETLIEAIEEQLWKDHPNSAKKIFGPRNRETKATLENYFEQLSLKYDLSKNHHKNKVKIGGNVIAGDAIIFDYISYRNNETKMKVEISFRKLDKDMELDIAVVKSLIGQSEPEHSSLEIFTPEDFEIATARFEQYLSDVLADKVG